MHTILQTQRLTIREFLPEEEAVYLIHYCTDEEVTRYLPKRNREERIILFNKAVAAYADSKVMGSWGIFGKADGDFIGCCLLRPFAGAPEKTELGYSLERKYWGQGIGTEMASAMVGLAFENTNATKVVAVTEIENIGSQRVLENAGLKRMDNIYKDGLELAYFEVNS